eukprot:scaffold126575_cov67-Attheya_sp.AAC.7
MLGKKKRSIVFKELCTLINSVIGISQTALTMLRLKNLTVTELLDEDNSDCYIMQGTWNRETAQTMKNLKGNARSLRIYREHVKECYDEVFLKDEYDDQFSGLLFFIGGHIQGQASHFKTRIEPLPIHADQLFNVGEDGDNCCCKMEINATHPKFVKSIEAIYKAIITEENGGLRQLVSPYNLSVSEVPLPPSLRSELVTATARKAERAQLSAKITNILFDGEGLQDLNAFWDKSTPDAEVAAMYNLVNMSAELNEAATEETNAAEAAAAVLADAEVTKSASNIAALAAEAATKKTKIAEDEAAAKHVQEKAAAAAILADAEVTKAADIAKAAEDEATAKLVQEKAAAAAVLADAE